MLLVALMLVFQGTPLPAASATPFPTEIAAPSAEPAARPTGASLPADCVRYEPDPCPSDNRRRPVESACVRAAQRDERCAQQTTGFTHYVALFRGGARWGITAGWYGRKTPRGRVYVENARRIFVQLGHDPSAPGSISGVARQTLIKIYGTDRPTPTTPFLADRRRPRSGRN